MHGAIDAPCPSLLAATINRRSMQRLLFHLNVSALSSCNINSSIINRHSPLAFVSIHSTTFHSCSSDRRKEKPKDKTNPQLTPHQMQLQGKQTSSKKKT